MLNLQLLPFIIPLDATFIILNCTIKHLVFTELL